MRFEYKGSFSTNKKIELFLEKVTGWPRKAAGSAKTSPFGRTALLAVRKGGRFSDGFVLVKGSFS
ncbi:hypothetical protein ACFQHW_02410 [Lapidilactobacillus achengensis]|uniref:Uncharacterized protein n=1 Tax=Lapidilactobacillus achengensis TaxID=2486000 RepID=A0ABW1UL78_9LACO|nr:hypothetical protein [Lapidilactobacillus achengensis]